jgi:hypothetical protein
LIDLGGVLEDRDDLTNEQRNSEPDEKFTGDIDDEPQKTENCGDSEEVTQRELLTDSSVDGREHV